MEKSTNHQFIVSMVTKKETTGMEEEKTRACKKKKKKCRCELVDYQSLPDFLKHNEFVRGYYRSEWPLKQTLLSIFAIHNETLNIWTHLIGFFIFFTLAASTIFALDTNISNTMSMSMHDPLQQVHHQIVMLHSVEQSNQTHKLQQQVITVTNSSEQQQPIAPRWPFYAYLAGAMFCLLSSSACHLLSCHSEHTCYVMLRLDYGGISALIVTSFYPLVYYTFACDPFFRDLYIGFITAFGVATVVASLLPVFEAPRYRFARAGLFACMGLSGVVPIVHKMAVFGDRPEAVATTGYEMTMLAFYGAGAAVYALRVPERWMPGRFDLAGHSHQLWHLLVIAGAYTHYLAGLVYLKWRDMEACS